MLKDSWKASMRKFHDGRTQEGRWQQMVREGSRNKKKVVARKDSRIGEGKGKEWIFSQFSILEN